MWRISQSRRVLFASHLQPSSLHTSISLSMKNTSSLPNMSKFHVHTERNLYSATRRRYRTPSAFTATRKRFCRTISRCDLDIDTACEMCTRESGDSNTRQRGVARKYTDKTQAHTL